MRFGVKMPFDKYKLPSTVVQEGVRLARPVGELLHKMAWCAMDVCWEHPLSREMGV